MGQGRDTPLGPLLAPMRTEALWWIAASGAAEILGCVAAGVRGDRVIRERHNGRVVLAAADGRAERSLRARGRRIRSGYGSGACDWPSPGRARDSRAFGGAGGDVVGRRTPLCFHHPPTATERRYGTGMAIPPSQAKARFPYPAGIRYTNGGGSTNGRTSRRTPPLD
jgi:hypothetical protein